MRFADDIDGLAGSAAELSELIKRLDESCSSYGMEISAEKTKVMTNVHVKNLQTEFKVKNSVLQIVDQFIYLGAMVTDNGSKIEILSRMAKAQSALSRLKIIWNDNHVSVKSKIRLLRSMVIIVGFVLNPPPPSTKFWLLASGYVKRLTTFAL